MGNKTHIIVNIYSVETCNCSKIKETKNISHLIHIFLFLLKEYINIICTVERKGCLIQNHAFQRISIRLNKVVKRLNTPIDFKLLDR